MGNMNILRFRSIESYLKQIAKLEYVLNLTHHSKRKDRLKGRIKFYKGQVEYLNQKL